MRTPARICLILDDSPDFCRTVPALAYEGAGIPKDCTLVARSLEDARAQLEAVGWPASGVELAFVCVDLALESKRWGWELFLEPPFVGRPPGQMARVVVHSAFLELVYPDPTWARLFEHSTLISKSEVGAQDRLTERMARLWGDRGRL